MMSLEKAAFTLAPFTADSAYLEETVRIYQHTWPDQAEEAHAFISSYATRPGFRGLVALVDGRVVGMGFGIRSLPGNWWHDCIAAQVGADHPALQDAWVLVELAVLPEFRDRHIGSTLLTELLRSQPCPRALLSTQVTNVGARRLYERHGWQYLHQGFVFKEGDEPFVVMSLELR